MIRIKNPNTAATRQIQRISIMLKILSLSTSIFLLLLLVRIPGATSFVSNESYTSSFRRLDININNNNNNNRDNNRKNNAILESQKKGIVSKFTLTSTLSTIPRNKRSYLQVSSSSSESEKEKKEKEETSLSILQLLQTAIKLLYTDLWFLPLLSVLSGLSPAVKIIGESHISRLPDCPIAHEIDTLLLWPAIMTTKSISTSGGMGVGDSAGDVVGKFEQIQLPPPTIFQAPFAAITDESMYDVDWSSVKDIYLSNVGMSLGISLILSFALVLFLEQDD